MKKGVYTLAVDSSPSVNKSTIIGDYCIINFIIYYSEAREICYRYNLYYIEIGLVVSDEINTRTNTQTLQPRFLDSDLFFLLLRRYYRYCKDRSGALAGARGTLAHAFVMHLIYSATCVHTDTIILYACRTPALYYNILIRMCVV